MGRIKYPEAVKGEVRGLLRLNWSFSAIVNEMAKRGYPMCKATISRIKNSDPKPTASAEPKKSSKAGRPPTLSRNQLKSLDHLTSQPNPPSKCQYVKRFSVSQPSICYNLRTKLGKKVIKK